MQEQYIPPQQVDPNQAPYAYAAYPDQQYEIDRQTTVDAQLDTAELIKKCENFLLGKHYDSEGSLKAVPGSQLMNDIGCRNIIFEISANLSSPVILANMTDEEAKVRAKDFEISLAQKLVNNYKEWGVEINKFDIIVDALGNLVFANLTRPISGKAHNGITTISRVHELQQVLTRDNIKDEPKKSMVNPLGWFKKGG